MQTNCAKQSHSHPTAQTPCAYYYYMQKTLDLYDRVHFNLKLWVGLYMTLSRPQSLWHQSAKSVVKTYQLWQLPGQGGWQELEWGQWLFTLCSWFLAALLISLHLFASRTDQIHSSASGHKRCRKLTFFCFVVVIILNQFLPSTSSEPVNIRLPTQEGKQTSQESASTRERLRSNQVPVKNVDCPGVSQAWG